MSVAALKVVPPTRLLQIFSSYYKPTNWAKVCKQVQNMLGRSRAKKNANKLEMGLPLMLIIYG